MEPFPGDASCVLTLLLLELDLQFSTEFLARAGHELLEGRLEDILSFEGDVDGLVFGLSSQSFEFYLEEGVFVIEGEEMGRGCGDFDDGEVQG